MFGFEDAEVIINSRINFDQKLKYYLHTYNDNLTLKNVPDKIRIIGFAYADSIDEIQKILM